MNMKRDVFYPLLFSCHHAIYEGLEGVYWLLIGGDIVFIDYWSDFWPKIIVAPDFCDVVFNY